jgi:hypothetical protein
LCPHRGKSKGLISGERGGRTSKILCRHTEVVQRCLKLPYCEHQRNRSKWFAVLISEVLASNPVPVTTLAEVSSAGLRKSRATKFCTVAANIFSTIVAGFFVSLHIKMCITSYAPSRKRQITVRLADHSRILGPRCGNFFMSPLLSLEFGGGV